MDSGSMDEGRPEEEGDEGSGHEDEEEGAGEEDDEDHHDDEEHKDGDASLVPSRKKKSRGGIRKKTPAKVEPEKAKDLSKEPSKSLIPFNC
jgi:hypothetical protein